MKEKKKNITADLGVDQVTRILQWTERKFLLMMIISQMYQQWVVMMWITHKKGQEAEHPLVDTRVIIILIERNPHLLFLSLKLLRSQEN